MIPAWFFVAFIAVLLWVSGNLLDKYLIERYFRGNNQGGGVGTLILFSTFFGFIVALFVLFYEGEQILYNGMSPILGASLGVLNALWVLLYLFALERTELSRTIPIFQTVPIFGLCFAFLILKETLSIEQMFSAGLIITGAFVLSYHTKGEKRGFDFYTLTLMLAASMIIAFSDVLFKSVAIDTNYWNTAFWESVGAGTFGLCIYTLVSPYRRRFNRFILSMNWQIFGTNGINEVLDNGANLVFAFATLLGPVALVETTNSYQPFLILIASIIFSRLIPNYYDEDIASTTLIQKLIGITIITIGSFMIYSTL